MIVIADTSPINYLILIGEQDLLHLLFGGVIIPWQVLQELRVNATPSAVRQWIGQPPAWLLIRKTTKSPDSTLSHLDDGEIEAIQLAEEMRADLLLVDEKAARKEAAKRHLATSGTLGVLDLAAERGLVDFSESLARLKQTSFRFSASVERFFLVRDARRKSTKPETIDS